MDNTGSQRVSPFTEAKKRKYTRILPTVGQVKAYREGGVLGNYLDGMGIKDNERKARGFGRPEPALTTTPNHL